MMIVVEKSHPRWGKLEIKIVKRTVFLFLQICQPLFAKLLVTNDFIKMLFYLMPFYLLTYHIAFMNLLLSVT